MLSKSVNFLIQNKVMVFVFVVLISFLGLTTAPFDLGFYGIPNNSLPVDAIPNVGDNQQIVFTEWEGQSPQDIEDQVTYPLTSALLGVPGVESVRSNSMFGFSSINVIFEDETDFYWSRSRLLEKLNTIPKNLLPEGVQPRLGPDATALGQIFWYTLEGKDENGETVGGWELQELRSIQDFYVKNALASTKGVSEVASVGGFVQEYQIDIDPESMRQYGVSLPQLVQAVKNTNRTIGAKTLEVNQVEYWVRGLGYVEKIEDLENTSITSTDFTSIHIKDVAKVSMGPAERRGILDKGGAEVAGGVVAVRFGANPMEVTKELKKNIEKISRGLPKKELKNGVVSKLTIVPFYDRSILIDESLDTLGNTLTFELLITILVIIVLLRSLKASFLVSGLLPLTVLMVFAIMKVFDIDANVVSLAGIAIAIGTMVDMGIILTENIVRKIDENLGLSLVQNISLATKEVSGAILAAGLTTIISFIPVFTLTGAEGRLFTPLAYTKTFAIAASMLVAIFIIPPAAAFLLKSRKKRNSGLLIVLLSLFGVVSVATGLYLGIIFFLFALIYLLNHYGLIGEDQIPKLNLVVAIGYIVSLLAIYWAPLGYESSFIINFIFIGLLAVLVLLPVHYFIKYYEFVLKWVLNNKILFLIIPTMAIFAGFVILQRIGKEFMPTLDEGEFLLMPTSLPQAGVAENNEVLKKLDLAVSAIPEVEYVVGKAGRVDSALDPAPLSMYENLISYKTEFIEDEKGKPIRFATDDQGNFITKSGGKVPSASKATIKNLVQDRSGAYYRNWREHIKTPEDIWREISNATHLPGVTSAPKLQPIETRLVMLQTGMRSNLGIKIKGQDLESINMFGMVLENELKEIPGIVPESVFADRISGKPYVLLNLDREKIARYGLSVDEVQNTIEVGIGGKVITQTIEGRERYSIRVRYPRELRGTPDDLESVYVALSNGESIPLGELMDITYEQGPQSIKSEDGFLVSYVIFDKDGSYSDVEIVDKASAILDGKITSGAIVVPEGVNFEFSGTYENHLHAQKSLSFILPLVLLVIFIVLYLQFRSVSVTLMVFSGIAVAFAGGFIMLWLYGQPWFMNISVGSINFRELFNIETVNLSVAVWVGFIALFGIATDDGVVMATYLTQTFKEKPRSDIDEVREGVIAAGKRRIRPCLMTSATTVLGLLPIFTATGVGSNIMIPMAIPCLGGILMGIITLFIVPVLFSWQKEVNLKNGSET